MILWCSNAAAYLLMSSGFPIAAAAFLSPILPEYPSINFLPVPTAPEETMTILYSSCNFEI
jgi:hypothetical protein